MAVAYVIPAIKYYGLSTDTKPTTLVTVGWMFREEDTHYTYMWNGTAWVGPIYWLGQVYPFEEN